MTPQNHHQILVNTCLKYFPLLEAIYIFGSWGTDHEKPDSDIDIAILFPAPTAKLLRSLYHSDLHQSLEKLYCKDIDLINVREVSTVLQKEIISAEQRIYCVNEAAADEFEMLTLSYYQKLNEERADILKAFFTTKRAVQ